MQKLKSILTYLLVGVILPLSFRPEALLDVRVWIMALGIVIVLLTQPAMDKNEARRNRVSDGNSFWWIYLMSILALLAPLLEWGYLHKTQTEYTWSLPVGLGLLAIGIAFRVWAIRTLGRYFTAVVQIVDEHRIITKGPYAWVRHPSYTGAYLSYLATGILFEAWWGLLFAALAMGLAYYHRISAEEVALNRYFGPVYAAYSARTKKIIPCLF